VTAGRYPEPSRGRSSQELTPTTNDSESRRLTVFGLVVNGQAVELGRQPWGKRRLAQGQAQRHSSSAPFAQLAPAVSRRKMMSAPMKKLFQILALMPRPTSWSSGVSVIKSLAVMCHLASTRIPPESG